MACLQTKYYTKEDMVSFALLDLAEFGWVLVDERWLAKAIANASGTLCVVLENDIGFLVEKI